MAERISLEGLCRALEIKAHQLYGYMDELYDELPADLACSASEVTELALHCLECETAVPRRDELWRFVGFKANKQWVWVALDRRSRQIVAFHVGDRSVASALALWQAIPKNYR